MASGSGKIRLSGLLRAHPCSVDATRATRGLRDDLLEAAQARLPSGEARDLGRRFRAGCRAVDEVRCDGWDAVTSIAETLQREL